MGVPKNDWLLRENPMKLDDLGVPLFMEIPMWLMGFPDWGYKPQFTGIKS